MERNIATDEKKDVSGTTFGRSLLALLLKLAIIAVIGVLLFGYVFGLNRNASLNMQPALCDGDLILYYRIGQRYSAGDVVMVRYQDRTLAQRVVAVAGDTVDITSAGLIINGSAVQEPGVLGETTQFAQGVAFPLTVPVGHLFLLGDNRPHATDSRIFGCVDIGDVKGEVIGLFRRRNL